MKTLISANKVNPANSSRFYDPFTATIGIFLLLLILITKLAFSKEITAMKHKNDPVHLSKVAADHFPKG